MAQTLLYQGAGPPTGNPDRLWYWDTLNHAGWWQEDGEPWKEFTEFEPVIDMDFCHHRLHVYTASKDFISVPNSGRMLEVNRLYCGDSIIVIWVADIIQAIGTRFNIIATISGVSKCQNLHNSVAQVLQGMVAFCFPANMRKPSQMRMDCDEVRLWGMLGTNGHWLIEPKFDAPFQFNNGIAEVIYYGQKRKINERGEFVD